MAKGDVAASARPSEFWPWSEKPMQHDGKTAGKAAGMLLAHKKADAEPVARKLEIRARIMRDMSWAVGQGGPGIPALREANVKMAADELDAAAAIIRRLGSTVPRTAQDEVNAVIARTLLDALRMVEGNTEGESWCAGVAMSALASLREDGLLDA